MKLSGSGLKLIYIHKSKYETPVVIPRKFTFRSLFSIGDSVKPSYVLRLHYGVGHG